MRARACAFALLLGPLDGAAAPTHVLQPDDPDAVVDSECRVIGVEGLRVVDSSVFPNITNGNINAPTMMVAEKAADHILGNKALDPDPAYG